ncbi:MAG: hypothetical protein FWD37_01510 [Methanomassiliicoccaceae archaeon]|nr:hypothetical protein [Methanomassiliicoccaceae archaeon]
MATDPYGGGHIISGKEAGEKLNEMFRRALNTSWEEMNIPDADELLENGRRFLEGWLADEEL